MKSLNLKKIAIITSLTICLTACQNKTETSKEEYNNSNNPKPIIEETITSTIPEETTTIPEVSTQTADNFTFFKDAKQEIISYIDSEEFEKIKEQGKYYVTTGIDFVFFDTPINGIYFNDLTEQLKQDIMRDIKALDESIMAYYPDYKENISTKYQIAAEFLSDKYYDVLENIKEYLGEENYNTIGEIKDQVIGDIGTKKDEVVEDIKELYKTWKNN